MKKVKWGIIGVGDVTEVKSGPAFNKIDNSEIVMVMRRNYDKAKDYAERHGIESFSNNADDIFKHHDINAVYISTPPSSHAEYCIRAAEAKKHVYVEKPMATSYKECQEMIDACNRNNVKLFVAYYRRELAYFKKVKELIDNSEIGEIKFVSVKLLLPPNKEDYNKNNLPWRVQKDISGGGYFYDLASHQFDFLDYVFGPIQTANGTASNQLNLYTVEDIISASFKFERNIIGNGLWCFSVNENDRYDKTEIIGTKGKLTFSFFSPDPITINIDGKDESIKIDYPYHVQESLISTVVNDILGNTICISKGVSAARTNWVLEQIIK